MRGVRPGPVDGAGQLGPGLHDPQPRVPGSHVIYNHLYSFTIQAFILMCVCALYRVSSKTVPTWLFALLSASTHANYKSWDIF